jgi:riboflavin kinase/FMN adenylyltransferase
MTTAPGTAASAIGELPAVGPAALCMGAFDGVHLGHLALVRATMRVADARGIRSVALVFDPHPDQVVRPGTVVPRLAPVTENLRLLAAAGIDAPLAVRFDAALRALAPEEFLAAMAPAIELRALVMTPESAFGRNRAGTPEAMREHGRSVGFEVVPVDEVVRDASGPISSARVRQALADGNIDGAARLLGHPPYLEASLGERVGSGWRLTFDYAPALPAPGAYPAHVRDDRPALVTVSADEDVSLTTASDVSGRIGLDLVNEG